VGDVESIARRPSPNPLESASSSPSVASFASSRKGATPSCTTSGLQSTSLPFSTTSSSR
ncbi:hypothetical protein LINPERPRIM_LOCUS11147, partial [Linum perenne]